MNRSRRRVQLASVVLAAGVALLGPHLAAAQECDANTACGAGYACQVSTSESCSGWACMPDEDCPEPVCETYESSWCAPAPCDVDADCPESMRCHSTTYLTCDAGMAGTGGGCAGDGCWLPPPPVEPNCWEETTQATCTPRHQLPCEVSADCGPGFVCREQLNVTCTGGGMGWAGTGAGGYPGGTGGAAGAGGMASDPLPADAGMAPSTDYTCTEEPSGFFYCELQEVPCMADADCEAGLECDENPNQGWCMGGAGTGGDQPVTCGGGPTHVCVPPGYYGNGASGSGAGGATGSAGMGAAGVGAGVDAGVGEEPPQMEAGGAAGGSPAAGSESGDDDSAPSNGQGRGHGLFGRGCSATSSAGAGSLGWMALGLIGLALRRRTRDEA